MRTRAACAGTVIAKRGHAAGVTEAMIREVDKMFGKPNDVESAICLRNAWHAINAYCHQHGIAHPAAQEQDNPQ
jgi:hypothetical protein